MEKILHYMFFCHRLSERSFFFKGKQFPICARCTGILLGYLIGIIYLIIVGKSNFAIIVLLITPLLIDGVGQLKGKWISNNFRRLITGIFAGIATILFLKFSAELGLNSGRYISKFILNK